jgi:hypothetical protein
MATRAHRSCSTAPRGACREELGAGQAGDFGRASLGYDARLVPLDGGGDQQLTPERLPVAMQRSERAGRHVQFEADGRIDGRHTRALEQA